MSMYQENLPAGDSFINSGYDFRVHKHLGKSEIMTGDHFLKKPA